MCAWWLPLDQRAPTIPASLSVRTCTLYTEYRQQWGRDKGQVQCWCWTRLISTIFGLCMCIARYSTMIPAYVIIAMGREGWYTREAVALTRALFFPRDSAPVPFSSRPVPSRPVAVLSCVRARSRFVPGLFNAPLTHNDAAPSRFREPFIGLNTSTGRIIIIVSDSRFMPANQPCFYPTATMYLINAS